MIEKALQFNTRRDVFWVSLATIGLLLCAYIYCVTVTIRNIVTEKRLTLEISNMNQKLSSKEFSLISMQNNVTLSYAESLGFSDPKQKVFITPRSVSFVSSTNNSI